MKFKTGSNFLGIIFLLLSSLFLWQCSYSFTGASVPPHLNSIAIPTFEDRSASGEAGLAEDFTDELITKFVDDNTLDVVDKDNADAVLDCAVTNLNDAPVSITSQGNEEVTARRINISVKVLYRDLVKRKTVFDKTFTNFGDYDPSGDIFTARQEAIKTAIDRITEDILLGVVSNW